MLPADFLEMRPCDWHAKKRGFFRKEEKAWEHTRLIVAALTGEKPQKIIQLSTDRKEVQHTTQEDARRILDRYKNKKTP